VLREERYTLLLVDPSAKYLFWLLVDIPSEALSSGNYAEGADGLTSVANFTSPTPRQRPKQAHYAVFVLFRQPKGARLADFYNADHALRSKYCTGHCIYRSGFELENFKQLHRLQLSAINWILVSYDFFEAARQIRIINGEENRSMLSINQKKETPIGSHKKRHRTNASSGTKSLTKEDKTQEICLLMDMHKMDTGMECEGQESSSNKIRSAERYLTLIMASVLYIAILRLVS